jgi:hypothetical protein
MANLPQYPVFNQVPMFPDDDDYYDDDDDDDDDGDLTIMNPQTIFGGFGVNNDDDEDAYDDEDLFNDDNDDDDDDEEDFDVNQFVTQARAKPAISILPSVSPVSKVVPRTMVLPAAAIPHPVKTIVAPVAPVVATRSVIPPSNVQVVRPAVPQTRLVLRTPVPTTAPLPGAAGTPIPGSAPVAPVAPVAQIPGSVSRGNIEQLLAKMPGVYTNAPTGTVVTDINDILKQNVDETVEDFEARRRLTLQLSVIHDFPLNPVSAVTIGQMLMKKAKLGMTYDADMEAALAYFTGLLQR